eukprot:3872340-Rhodomonas_salina.4
MAATRCRYAMTGTDTARGPGTDHAPFDPPLRKPASVRKSWKPPARGRALSGEVRYQPTRLLCGVRCSHRAELRYISRD